MCSWYPAMAERLVTSHREISILHLTLPLRELITLFLPTQRSWPIFVTPTKSKPFLPTATSTSCRSQALQRKTLPQGIEATMPGRCTHEMVDTLSIDLRRLTVSRPIAGV